MAHDVVSCGDKRRDSSLTHLVTGWLMARSSLWRCHRLQQQHRYLYVLYLKDTTPRAATAPPRVDYMGQLRASGTRA